MAGQAARQKGGGADVRVLKDDIAQPVFNHDHTNVLKCLYTNADSLSNKKSELLTMVDAEKVDVISVTEGLPKNQQQRGRIEPVEFQIDGFDCFHNIGDKSCCRGVVLWIRSKFNAQSVELTGILSSSSESVWCEISLKGNDKLLVGSVYRSPNSTHDNDTKINELIVKMTEGRSHALITGDFNFPELDWIEELSPKNPDHPASKFMEAIRDSFLTQHVKKPTHFRSAQTPNVLDLVFTSEQSMVDSIRHEAPLGKSHHHILCFDFKCYTRRATPSEPRYCFTKGNYSKLAE